MEPDGSSALEERAADIADATRRTLLANERTELAWWRTGLTALAVALAVGRVVPEFRALAGGGVALGLLTAILILLD